MPFRCLCKLFTNGALSSDRWVLLRVGSKSKEMIQMSEEEIKEFQKDYRAHKNVCALPVPPLGVRGRQAAGGFQPPAPLGVAKDAGFYFDWSECMAEYKVSGYLLKKWGD
jgi:hypothetical protein